MSAMWWQVDEAVAHAALLPGWCWAVPGRTRRGLRRVAGCKMVRCSRVLDLQALLAMLGPVAMLWLVLATAQLSAGLADELLMQVALL